MILDELVSCSQCGRAKPYPDTDADASWTHAADGGHYEPLPRELKRLEWDAPAPTDLFGTGESA